MDTYCKNCVTGHMLYSTVEIVNTERGSLNNTLTCTIHLQVENEIVSSPSRICNIFNVTFLDTINKLLFDKNLMHSQTSNNIICQRD
jgi:hypothetical protein